jgi:hypothetical protein
MYVYIKCAHVLGGGEEKEKALFSVFLCVCMRYIHITETRTATLSCQHDASRAHIHRSHTCTAVLIAHKT